MDPLDLMIVCAENDAVGRAVGRSAAVRGLHVRIADVAEYVRSVTIRVGGNGAVVDPDRPLFLHGSWSATSDPVDPDAYMATADGLATVCAAGALSRSTVVNRPSEASGFGQLAGNGYEVGARAALHGRHLRTERFVSSLLPEAAQVEGWELQDVISSTTAWSPSGAVGGGPTRLREGCWTDEYARVVVVGEQWWSRRPVAYDGQDLGRLSVDLVTGLGLLFAVVTWRTSTGDPALANPDLRARRGVGDPHLARVDAAPDSALIEPFLAPVAEALVTLLIPESA